MFSAICLICFFNQPIGLGVIENISVSMTATDLYERTGHLLLFHRISSDCSVSIAPEDLIPSGDPFVFDVLVIVAARDVAVFIVLEIMETG